MDTKTMLELLTEPLNVNIRIFVVDYKDSLNKYYNCELHMHVNCSDDFLVNSIKDMYAKDGFTVYSIFEIISNMSFEELETLATNGSLDIFNNIKSLYLDFNKAGSEFNYV